jgi:pSer/pThr/pTyr-binding forkhead associated (FHA) protein
LQSKIDCTTFVIFGPALKEDGNFMPAPGSQNDEGRCGWLVPLSDSVAGRRHRLAEGTTRVGRDPSNDIVIGGQEARFVSSRHLEIRLENDSYRLYDLGSLNGTYVDGSRVTEAALGKGARIQLGPGGPEFVFDLEQEPLPTRDRTIPMPAVPGKLPPPVERGDSKTDRPIEPEHERLLSAAVRRARQARRSGQSDQTAIIMREMLGTAIRRASRRFRRIIVVLIFALIAISAWAAWSIYGLRREKNNIDTQIRDLEAMLSRGGNPQQLETLINRLQDYEQRAVALQRNVLYRLGVRSYEQDYVEQEIKSLLAGFGAEEYSIPPEFVQQVNRFIRQYQERDRLNMERLLGRAHKELQVIRSTLLADNLPPDLAYVVLVESAFISDGESSAGAVGIWQFTPETARTYGMRVDDEVDERLDILKSTRGASRYIRDLILDFGSGSSVMLALAAYNVGPSKVKRAIRNVSDPIKQRNFWYLYRIRALPAETREYIPKIFAAMIIGRNPAQFGF